MKNSKAKASAPPLSVWATVVALYIVLSLAAFLSFERLRTHVMGKEIQSVMDSNTCREGETRILAFGSSMTRTAIANRFEYRRWQTGMEPAYCLVRAGYVNIALESFLRTPSFFREVASAQPDVLLLESTFLCYYSRKRDPLSQVKPRQSIRLFGQHLIAKNRYTMEDYPRPFFQGRLDQQEMMEEVERSLKNRKLRDEADMLLFLDKCIATMPETRIIIIDIPRPPAIQQALDQRHGENLENFRNRLSREKGIEWWEWDGQVDVSDFFDVVHLNRDGMNNYMLWLTDRISKELE